MLTMKTMMTATTRMASRLRRRASSWSKAAPAVVIAPIPSLTSGPSLADRCGAAMAREQHSDDLKKICASGTPGGQKFSHRAQPQPPSQICGEILREGLNHGAGALGVV